MIKKIFKTYALVAMFFGACGASAQTLEGAIAELDAERFTAANDMIAKLVQSNPSAENSFYQGYILLKSPEALTNENLSLAEKAFQAGIATGDKKGALFNQIGMGMLKLAKKDLSGAKAILEAVKKDSKLKNPEILYRVAEAYTLFTHTNDPAQAIMDIQLALDKSKVVDNPEYYYVKSDAYLIKNEGGDAMTALQNAERIGKKLPKTYAKMARVWLRGRNYREATETLKMGLSVDSKYAPLYKYQSALDQTLGRYAESAENAKKYLVYSDGDCKAKLRYTKLAFVAKDFASVRTQLPELKSCSKDPYIYRLEGIVDFEENKPESSIENFNKFIQNIPEDESPALDYGYIGRAHFKLEGDSATIAANEVRGLEYIEKAISMGDSTQDYYGDLAQICVKRKDYGKAAVFMEKALARKKDVNAADYATVGAYFNAARNYDEADKYVDKALDLYKGAWVEGYLLSAKIKTYKNLNNSEYLATYGAASVYEKYLSLLTEDQKLDTKNRRNVVDAYKYLAGREFQVNKNADKGVEYLSALLKYDPENEEAKRLIEKRGN